MSCKVIFMLMILAGIVESGFCQTNGYADIDQLYADFVIALKSDNDDKLKAFSVRISPDESTGEYMKKIGFSYRGIPDKLETQKVPYSQLAEGYFRDFLKFRERLKSQHKLSTLKYLGRDNKRIGFLTETFNISVSESYINLISGESTMSVKIGEMLKINNCWKVFTRPVL